jgi:hypothetical protein
MSLGMTLLDLTRNARLLSAPSTNACQIIFVQIVPLGRRILLGMTHQVPTRHA